LGPLPWLERWLPVLLPLLNVVLFATIVRALVPKLAPDDRRAQWAAAVGIGLFGLFAGHDAFGPDLGGDAHRALGWAFGALLALIGAGLTLRRGEEAGRGRVAAMVLGFALGVLPAAVWLAAERALVFEDVDEVGEERARWARRLTPNEGRPWLALALSARGRDQNEHALAMADVAEGLRPDDDRFQARILELRADVHAARGDCERARALFDEALEARARAAMESLDLDLSEAYRLPPALAAECGLED
jgi:tetratricopeptide (TPR) repeat protein